MSSLIKKIIRVRISDYFITLFVLLIGCAVSLYIIFSMKSIADFFAAFKNPLFLSLYYLWIKAIVIDIQRITGEKEPSHNHPGTVYWVYASQWIIYWLIHDMAVSSSQLSSALNGNTSWTVSQYFSNNSLFWLFLDGISTFLLIPFRYLFTNHKTINSFLLLDYLKFLLIFAVFTVMSFF